MPLIFVVGFVLIAYDLLYVVFDVVVVVREGRCRGRDCPTFLTLLIVRDQIM